MNIKYYFLQDPEEERISTLSDLLLKMPYLLTLKLIPPRSIVNEILESGIFDAGMSGGLKWKPFSISESEYDLLVSDLKARGMQYVEPSSWVSNQSDWHIWVMEYVKGVPASEHKKLSDEEYRIVKARKEAYESGDKELGDRLHLEAVDAGNKLADFLQKYIS